MGVAELASTLRVYSGRHPVPDPHAPHHIPRHEPIDDVHPVHHVAEHRVARVEVRLRRVRDEELAAAGVLPVERHADGAAQIRPLVDLVANRVARPALAVAARIAVLHDEVGHDAVDRDAVEEALPRQRR